MAYLQKRGGTYYIYWRTGDGKKRGKSLGTDSKQVAEQFLHRFEVERTRRRLGQEVDVALPALHRDYIAAARSRLRQTTLDKHLAPRLEKFMEFAKERTVKLASRISLSLLQDWQTKLIGEGLSNRTINHYLYAVSGMLRYAVERGLLQHNAARDVRKLKVTNNPPRWLTKDEWAKVKEAAESGPLWPLVATAYYAGLRSGELRHLTWGEIDFDSGLITIRNKPDQGFTLKNRTSRTVPLHSALADILRPVAEGKAPGSLCFPSQDGDPFGDWEVNEDFKEHVAAPSGVDCSLKHLRSTFASRLVQQGVSIYKASRWLGHKSVTTTERHYAHLAPRDDEIEVL